MATSKQWGDREFWGASFDYDPQWLLDEEQKIIQSDLVEICRTTLRPNAIHANGTYIFPRRNLKALATMGLLGLLVPKELGGKGQSHQCACMVVETIARYGCPSTAVIYVMHLGACAALLLRHHNNETIKNILRRVDKDCFIGTLSYSDPATGGHFWYPMSSKCWEMPDGRFQTLKYGSWASSAGVADWYAVQVVGPRFDGNFSNLSTFIFFKDEVRTNTDAGSAMGLSGNHWGPLVAEGLLSPERLIGNTAEGRLSIDECHDPFLLLLTSCVWNGISLGCIDIAKKHVTSKGHADVGLQVCDYPTIQDYFGESVCSTNSCRLMVTSIATRCDEVTNGCDWSIHEDPKKSPRSALRHWFWQVKFQAAKNVQKVSDVMLQACGGSGYKTDLGLERLLRDGKAGWVMGPSNEILRQFVGKTVLMGLDIIDYWTQKVNERNLNMELKKLDKNQKSELVDRLMFELKLAEETEGNNNNEWTLESRQFFEEPFGVLPAKRPKIKKGAQIALDPEKDTEYTLIEVQPLTPDGKVAKMVFDAPSKNATMGTFPGQFIQIRVPTNGVETGRYVSPTSDPSVPGKLEIAIRYENQGHLAKYLNSIKPGAVVNFRGPFGGLQYEANQLDHVIFICSGIGVTPAIQVIRSTLNNQSDRTKVTLLYQAKDPGNILYKSELDDSAKDPRITIRYTVQDADGDWIGPTGNIGQDFLKASLNLASDESRKVVICGGTPMCRSCIEALYRTKFRSDELFLYGPFGAEIIWSVYGRGAKLTTNQLVYQAFEIGTKSKVGESKNSIIDHRFVIL